MGELDRDAYMEHRYSSWHQQLVHNRETRIVDEFLERMEGVRRVLDAPCGHGRWTGHLHAAAGSRPVSVDRDIRHLRALRRAEDDPDWPIVRVRLGEPLPFDDGAFDLCFSFRFLHHVRDPDVRRDVLAELARVTTRYMIVSYYATGSLHSLQREYRRVLKRRKRRGLPRLALIPRHELATLAGELGFSVLDDRAIIPGVHAQRVALLETRG